MLSGPGCTSKGFHCLPDCLSTSFSTNSPSAFAVLESTPPDAGSSLDDASAMIGRGRRKAAGLQDEIRSPARRGPMRLRQLRLDRRARTHFLNPARKRLHSSTRNPCEPTAPNLVADRDAAPAEIRGGRSRKRFPRPGCAKPLASDRLLLGSSGAPFFRS